VYDKSTIIDSDNTSIEMCLNCQFWIHFNERIYIILNECFRSVVLSFILSPTGHLQFFTWQRSRTAKMINKKFIHVHTWSFLKISFRGSLIFIPWCRNIGFNWMIRQSTIFLSGLEREGRISARTRPQTCLPHCLKGSQLKNKRNSNHYIRKFEPFYHSYDKTIITY